MASAVVRQHKYLGTLADGFWLDAGWFDRAGEWEKGYWWHSAVGNWHPDSRRFPDGMAPVADAIHEAGNRFMLWYEPERANVDSDWAHEHPEWMLAESGAPAVPVDAVVDSAFIVNLGIREAREWVSREIVQSLSDNRVDVYRQDFNIDPEAFWTNNDEPGRTGMCEVLYINGLYAYLDYLREQLPHIIIDNCAGGGRRLDLEMLSRGICMWRSDYSLDVEARQCHTYNLHQWIPEHCTNATGSKDPYDHLSGLGPGSCFNWSVFKGKGPDSIDDRRVIIELFRAMREYYYEDFYPLSGDGDLTGEDVWLAYQLHRPSDGSGYVVAFRRKDSTDASQVVALRGLDPDAGYSLSFVCGEGDSTVLSGRDLASGLTLTLDPRSALVIRYDAVK